MLEFRQIASQAQFGDITALTQWGVRFSPFPGALSSLTALPASVALCTQQGVLGNRWVEPVFFFILFSGLRNDS